MFKIYKLITITGLLLIFIVAGKAEANSCEGISVGKVFGLKDGSRNMKVVDPYNPPNLLYVPYAGTFDGKVDGNYTAFYCVDIRNALGFNEDYSDSAYVKPKINYILLNYFPNKTSYTGRLPLDSNEAAAVQFAIWHFSDNLDVTSLQNNNPVRDRALEIISDANLNGGTFVPVHTLKIIPVSILSDPAIADTIKVKVSDELGNPLSGVQVNLSISDGTLSSSVLTSDVNGFTPNIVVTKGTGLTTMLSVTAYTIISPGRHYIHISSPLTKQKIALAKPVNGNLIDCLELTWDSTSSGGNGGIESTYDMAEAMMLRHLKISNGETSKLVANQDFLFAPMFELQSVVPNEGPYNSVATETTPFDILGISNATSAYAVDYLKNGNRVGVVFSTTTNAPEIYSHSKSVCDRFGLSELDELKITYVNNREFYIAHLNNPVNNETDYAISFSIYETPNGHIVDNKWAIEDYHPGQNVTNIYNFQVWGLTEFAVQKIVGSILDKFDALSSLSYQSEDLINPDIWVISSRYLNSGKIKMVFSNNTNQTVSVPVNIKFKREQNSQQETQITNLTLPPDVSEAEISIGLLSSANISVASPSGFLDAIFVGSGMFGNYSGPLSTINNFEYISNYGTFHYPAGAYAFTGGINMSGNLGDVVYIARSLNAAFVNEDLSQYSNLQFKTKGTGVMTVQLEAIQNGVYVYPFVNINLDNSWSQQQIQLSDFRVNGQAIDRSNVKMVLFKLEKNYNQNISGFNYAVKDIFFEHSTTNITGNGTETIENFKLNQNFPNPFNPQTTITFDIATESHVSLTVYDMTGREVALLINKTMKPGANYSVTFNGSGLASGLYIYRLATSEGINLTKKMLLIK
ncbi:MAG: Cys-Gln thioester bond-forming surface protein [Ignavibacteriaceae bacterium]|jgi:hypothetical protein|nr:MAG: 5'-nucleotidase [Chlorobi bacterium OLB4]MBW7856461.1 Cys-Gln thioester bond-forming surface protein [Ignavibacteria bacterium]MEB2330075.1 Cys-Gln thioester bond-forming surface protein [Ignavibacteriaceae bacterium]OQY78687.1 MAG: hypothetical protein B6D43_01535 [Ignavibacteriales bacterium UTCHB1]